MLSYVLSLKLPKKIIIWAKIAVLGGLVAYIGYVVRQQPFDWTLASRSLRTVEHPIGWALALALLVPFNWGFEAKKWQMLLRRIEPVSFREAYQGVLAGLVLGFALPAQIGDTAGRVLSLRNNRTAAIGASLVSGGLQFYVALVFGAIAWAWQLNIVPERNTGPGRWLLLAVLAGLGVIFGFIRQQVIQPMSHRFHKHRLAPLWLVAGQYHNRELGLAFCAAVLRYLVFSAQFYLSMRLGGLTFPPDVAASGIALVFLAKTITPAFNLLSDLGVREAASLWVFAPFGVPAPVLLMATLTLWLVNVLSPVLIGMLWVWKLKLTAE